MRLSGLFLGRGCDTSRGMGRFLPLLFLACVSPRAMEVKPAPDSGEQPGAAVPPDSKPPPRSVDASVDVSAPVDACMGFVCEFPPTAPSPYPTCSARPLRVCVLYVTQYPASPGADTAFCELVRGGSGPGLAFEATGDAGAFVARWRPHVCEGRAQGTRLTLETWTYDDDGKHGVRATSSEACP